MVNTNVKITKTQWKKFWIRFLILVFKNLNVISRRLYSSSEEISPTYKNRNPR